MAKPEVIALGEALIDITPRLPGGNIVATGEMYMSASGAPAIVAAALAKLGTATGFIGKVGTDFFGYHLKDALDALGVDTAGLTFDKDYNTGLAFVNWDERGNAQYLFYRKPSADTMLATTDINPEYIAQAKALHFGSLMLATEPSGEATRFALQVARENKLILSYDINLRLAGWRDEATARAGVSYPLDFATIVKVNRPELAFLTGVDDPAEGTAKLWRENYGLIIVTLDKDGCYYRTANASGKVAGFEAKSVDTVGAGDGFIAGVLDMLNRGGFAFGNEALIRKACLQGNAVGSLAVSRQGAIPSLPARPKVERLFRTRII
jgi:sugar/nucleoside kinase (ribokinase family)